MIIGLGTGEGELEAGAVSRSESGKLRLSEVRTRSQLDALKRSTMGSHQENLPEDMDESILDEESETESHEESVGAAAGDRPGAKMVSTDGTLSAPEARRDGQAEHNSRADDAVLVDKSDMVSGRHNRSTMVKPMNLEIGTGHATVIAARKAASGDI